MAIASLYEYPATPEALQLWSFQHAAHHRDCIRIIKRDQNVELDERIVDPFDPQHLPSLQSWLNGHQDMHDQVNGQLGLDGHAIWDIDWNDMSQMEPWLLLHVSEHLAWGQLLNLG